MEKIEIKVERATRKKECAYNKLSQDNEKTNLEGTKKIIQCFLFILLKSIHILYSISSVVFTANTHTK